MDNGATESQGTPPDRPLIFIGGPIRYWWTPTTDGKTLHESEEFVWFDKFRTHLRDRLSDNFLTYSPWLALKGPWNETVGQMLNNTAVNLASAFVRIDIPHVEAVGTNEEDRRATAIGLRRFQIVYRPDQSFSINRERADSFARFIASDLLP